MSPLIWLVVFLISGLAAFFASLLGNSAASGAGAFIVLAIIAGVFWYLFGPRPRRKPESAPHEPSE